MTDPRIEIREPRRQKIVHSAEDSVVKALRCSQEMVQVPRTKSHRHMNQETISERAQRFENSGSPV